MVEPQSHESWNEELERLREFNTRYKEAIAAAQAIETAKESIESVDGDIENLDRRIGKVNDAIAGTVRSLNALANSDLSSDPYLTELQDDIDRLEPSAYSNDKIAAAQRTIEEQEGRKSEIAHQQATLKGIQGEANQAKEEVEYAALAVQESSEHLSAARKEEFKDTFISWLKLPLERQYLPPIPKVFSGLFWLWGLLCLFVLLGSILSPADDLPIWVYIVLLIFMSLPPITICLIAATVSALAGAEVRSQRSEHAKAEAAFDEANRNYQDKQALVPADIAATMDELAQATRECDQVIRDCRTEIAEQQRLERDSDERGLKTEKKKELEEKKEADENSRDALESNKSERESKRSELVALQQQREAEFINAMNRFNEVQQTVDSDNWIVAARALELMETYGRSEHGSIGYYVRQAREELHQGRMERGALAHLEQQAELLDTTRQHYAASLRTADATERTAEASELSAAANIATAEASQRSAIANEQTATASERTAAASEVSAAANVATAEASQRSAAANERSAKANERRAVAAEEQAREARRAADAAEEQAREARRAADAAEETAAAQQRQADAAERAAANTEQSAKEAKRGADAQEQMAREYDKARRGIKKGSFDDFMDDLF